MTSAHQSSLLNGNGGGGNGADTENGTTTGTKSNKWRLRLEKKLNVLGETSSKETYQTLAKWIEFNRKRTIEDFVPVFQDLLRSGPTGRQLLYLQLSFEN